MSLKAVFFDLDGTLLPMDQDAFVKSYFSRLAQKMVPYGFDPQILVKGIWAGTAAMVKNDGSSTNEERFWQVFPTVCGEAVLSHKETLEDFYRNEFQNVKDDCGYSPEAAQVISLVKQFGWTPVLATNPIFPAIATQSRVRWAGLNLEDFAHYTVYENSRFSKPNPDYYRSLLQLLNLSPEEGLKVGNDVGEDMIAAELGMKVFLLTDCIINKSNADISVYPNGSFAELKEYLRSLAE